MAEGGMARRLVNLARVFVGWIRGGLALVNIVASTLFGCISAFVAALASSALSPDATHDRVKAIAKHKPNARALALFGFLTVDRPGDSKPIREHTKAVSPERFLKRHANGPSFRQFRKQAFRIAFTWVQSDHEAPGGLIRAWSRIGSLQSGIADDQRGVSNLAAPFRGASLAMGESAHVSMNEILPFKQRS